MECSEEAQPELELAHACIEDLKAELELERRMRRKAEATSKALSRELADERQAREAAEGVLRRLEEAAQRAAREMEEERRMLHIAELWREERVQMKLVEAKLVMEEKLQEMLKLVTSVPPHRSSSPVQTHEDEEEEETSKEEVLRVSGGRSQHGRRQGQPRRGAENPHIRRGIRGFVEFPRPKPVMKTTERSSGSSREGRAAESNLECQRAQLRILLRNRNPNGLASHGDFSQFRDLIH